MTPWPPQTSQSVQLSENHVDSELLEQLDPWKDLSDIISSPGSRENHGPEVTSVVGPQSPTNWLYKAETTQAPSSPPSPPPSPPPDSQPSGNSAQNMTDSLILGTIITCFANK